MHVLVTADTLGGVWTYTQELVEGLHSCGHTVTLVSFGDIPALEQTAWLLPLKRVDFRPTAFRLEWMQDVQEDLAASTRFLLALIEEVKPDLLHFNQFHYGDIACEVPRLVVAHSDVCTWWRAVHGTNPPDNDWIRGYRQSVARAVNGADVIVAPSRWMLDSFRSEYGNATSSAVIYNGLRPRRFYSNPTKKNNALSVGRIWDLGKNSVLLSRIGSPIPIFLIGSDKDPSGSPDGPLDRSTIGALQFLGPKQRNELLEELADASIYIATSQYEPFGLAPLEAAFSKCAIVASDIGSLREIWADAAIYFTNNDALSLQHALERLVGDRNLIEAAANKAYERALALYSTDRMIDDYLGLYRNLVGTSVVAA